jgi:hypothetical protein
MTIPDVLFLLTTLVGVLVAPEPGLAIRRLAVLAPEGMAFALFAWLGRAPRPGSGSVVLLLLGRLAAPIWGSTLLSDLGRLELNRLLAGGLEPDAHALARGLLAEANARLVALQP